VENNSRARTITNLLLDLSGFIWLILDMLQINEPINVWVSFEGNLIRPLVFLWRQRRIKIDTVNLVHTSKSGASVFYHFSVSAGNNFYRLMLDSTKLKWTMEMVEEDS
jgi:hypothetical protein